LESAQIKVVSNDVKDRMKERMRRQMNLTPIV